MAKIRGSHPSSSSFSSATRPNTPCSCLEDHPSDLTFSHETFVPIHPLPFSQKTMFFCAHSLVLPSAQDNHGSKKTLSRELKKNLLQKLLALQENLWKLEGQHYAAIITGWMRNWIKKSQNGIKRMWKKPPSQVMTWAASNFRARSKTSDLSAKSLKSGPWEMASGVEAKSYIYRVCQ